MSNTFTVGQASERIGVSIDTLRYYEREGLICIPRNASNHRCYTENDLSWLRTLMCLRETGMPIRKIREFSMMWGKDTSNFPDLIALLEAHRLEVLERMKVVEHNLKYVEGKISWLKSKT